MKKEILNTSIFSLKIFYKIHLIIVTGIISTSSMILNTSTIDVAILCWDDKGSHSCTRKNSKLVWQEIRQKNTDDIQNTPLKT